VQFHHLDRRRKSGKFSFCCIASSARLGKTLLDSHSYRDTIHFLLAEVLRNEVLLLLLLTIIVKHRSGLTNSR